MLKLFTIFILLCSSTINEDSIELIDKAIEFHGGKNIHNLHYKFQFRNTAYEVSKSGGTFEYKREVTDLSETYTDVLNNHGFERLSKDIPLDLSAKKIDSYSNSLNSVAYFTLIPFVLKDEAVVSKYIGKSTIKGESYYKVEVTFKAENGGTDFQDVYVYWLHTKNYSIDYLAYSFHVNGGGMRFREAINRRRIKGIIFQDYINYKPLESNSNVRNLDMKFSNEQLIFVSEILTEKVQVIR